MMPEESSQRILSQTNGIHLNKHLIRFKNYWAISSPTEELDSSSILFADFPPPFIPTILKHMDKGGSKASKECQCMHVRDI